MFATGVRGRGSATAGTRSRGGAEVAPPPWQPVIILAENRCSRRPFHAFSPFPRRPVRRPRRGRAGPPADARSGRPGPGGPRSGGVRGCRMHRRRGRRERRRDGVDRGGRLLDGAGPGQRREQLHPPGGALPGAEHERGADPLCAGDVGVPAGVGPRGGLGNRVPALGLRRSAGARGGHPGAHPAVGFQLPVEGLAGADVRERTLGGCGSRDVPAGGSVGLGAQGEDRGAPAPGAPGGREVPGAGGRRTDLRPRPGGRDRGRDPEGGAEEPPSGESR